SPVTARPTWPATLLTLGMARRSPLALATIRLISKREVPGGPSRWTTKFRSLNEGMNGPSSAGITARPATPATTTATTTARGLVTIRDTADLWRGPAHR